MSANVERYSRQRQLVPREHMAETPVSVVGVGAIGRAVALTLASMGVQRLRLVDFDVVELTNVVTQGYREEQVGVGKVRATASDCLALNSGIDVEVVEGRFRRSMAVVGAVFVCVDDMSSRRLVWEAVREAADVVVDGRMSAEVLRVVTVGEPLTDVYYRRTLFRDADAHEGACTAKSTFYCANVAAGMMCGQYAKWLRSVPCARDVVLNLLSMELSVVDCGRAG